MYKIRSNALYVTLVLLLMTSGLYAAKQAVPVVPDLPPLGDLIVQREADPLARLDQLIAVTQHNLAVQKEVRDLAVQFQQAHQNFTQNSDDREQGKLLVLSAQSLLQRIQDNHLIHLFNDQFLRDIAQIARIPGQQNISRP